MRVRCLRSFDQTFERLHQRDQTAVKKALGRLLDYFSGASKPLGLGLRKLRGSFWEIRASLDKRVLFKLERDIATFVMTGSHDEVSQTLRRR